MHGLTQLVTILGVSQQLWRKLDQKFMLGMSKLRELTEGTRRATGVTEHVRPFGPTSPSELTL